MIEVVAAYIRENGKFLICQRPENKECALLWEFVGGKVEEGETKAEALIRECKEELGVVVSVGEVFTEVTHSYPEMTVHLTILNCAIVDGEPKKLEHEDIRWIKAEEISDFEFCPADTEILQKIQEEARLESEQKHSLGDLLDRAMLLAIAAHKGQVDIAEEPYIFHPLRVMLSCKTEEERICGVLHDVIEDTPITLADLRKEGFSDKVIEAIDCLSRRKEESYSEFITRILDNELACRVKLADLADNMDLSRIMEPDEEDYQRVKKYEKAKKRIEERLAMKKNSKN